MRNGTHFVPKALLWGAAAISVGIGCSRAGKQPATSAGSATSEFVLVYSPGDGTRTLKVPVDPEDLAPGVLSLAKIVCDESIPVRGATAEKPAPLGVVFAECGAFGPREMGERKAGGVKIALSMRVSTKFHPVHLVQTADNRFAWGRWEPNRAKLGPWQDKFHPDWFESPKEATEWLAEYTADAYENYRIDRAVFQDRLSTEALANLEKELREQRPCLVNRLLAALRRQNKS